MKTILITLAIFLVYYPGYSQEVVTDSLLGEICLTLKNSDHLDDSSRVSTAFEKHLGPIFEKLNDSQKESTWNNIFFRLQRNCFVFHSILLKNSVQKGDWEELHSMPARSIGREICQQFNSHSSFRYLERSGDTVQVVLKNGIWSETFIDGTFSKLKFRWLDDCSFEIEFLESDNLVRKNFSKKGDKYIYTILEKGNRFYKLAVEIPVSNRISAFKLYID